MRIPIPVSLESRDGTVTKDAKVLNGIIEGGSIQRVKTRPGSADLGSVRSGTAQGAYYFNSQYITAHANTADRSTIGPLANNSIGAIAGARAVSSATNAAGTATVTTSAIHGLRNGDTVTIAGANQTEYNGAKTITVTGTQSFTYAITGSPASPATGTLTATPAVDTGSQPFDFADNGLTVGTTGYLLVKSQYSAVRIRSDWNVSAFFFNTDAGGSGGIPPTTTRGCVFLDGYFFLMDLMGRIWNSDLNVDPSGLTAWDATSFITADKAPGAGVYLGRSQNYIVALKDYSTEPFYDAGNPAPGSPLSPVEGGFSEIGCASGASVASIEGQLLFVSQVRGKGRSVYLMSGLQQQKISTPDVDRILDADDLAAVYSYVRKIGGHSLYILTLGTSNITLVYDFQSQTWVQWSSLTIGSPVSVSSITLSGTTATVTAAGHGLSDGDPVKIAGADQSAYNGIFQASYVSSSVFTFQVTGSPATPATGTITATPYTESYYKFTRAVGGGGQTLLLHETDGHVYQPSTTTYQDAGIPINVFTRTIKLDAGALGWKRMSRLSLIGDTVSDYVMVRWSDDDSATHSAYKQIDLSVTRPNTRRCGAFRRRVIETRFIGNNPLRLEAFEPEIQ